MHSSLPAIYSKPSLKNLINKYLFQKMSNTAVSFFTPLVLFYNSGNCNQKHRDQAEKSKGKESEWYAVS